MPASIWWWRILEYSWRTSSFSFSKLMETVRHTNESIRKTSRSNAVARPHHPPTPRRHQEKGQKARLSTKTRGSSLPVRRGLPSRREILKGIKCYLFSLAAWRGATLSERRIKDQVILLSYIERFPCPADQRDADYCPYHQRKGHPLEQCATLGGYLMRNTRYMILS